MNTQIDFEEWAKLLITRKVPDNFGHLINSEVIHSGAEILKHGDAFEVHLEGMPPGTTAHLASTHERIFVTPMPRLARLSAN
jgi:hypothetical protein